MSNISIFSFDVIKGAGHNDLMVHNHDYIMGRYKAFVGEIEREYLEYIAEKNNSKIIQTVVRKEFSKYK